MSRIHLISLSVDAFRAVLNALFATAATAWSLHSFAAAPRKPILKIESLAVFRTMLAELTGIDASQRAKNGGLWFSGLEKVKCDVPLLTGMLGECRRTQASISEPGLKQGQCRMR